VADGIGGRIIGKLASALGRSGDTPALSTLNASPTNDRDFLTAECAAARRIIRSISHTVVGVSLEVAGTSSTWASPIISLSLRAVCDGRFDVGFERGVVSSRGLQVHRSQK